MPRSRVVELLAIGHKQHLFKECLPYSGYSTVNGPFLRLWIRFGFDPTIDPISRMYQCVICKFPSEFLLDISNRYEVVCFSNSNFPHYIFRLINHIGKERCERRMVDLDRMCLTDEPAEFAHVFINKGSNARLPVYCFGNVLKHQVFYQVSSTLNVIVVCHRFLSHQGSSIYGLRHF